MADPKEVAVEMNGANGKASDGARMSFKEAGGLVVAENRRPKEALLAAVHDARVGAGHAVDSRAASAANQNVIIDSMGHAGGFASSFMMLRSMRPYAPNVLLTCVELFRGLLKLEPLIGLVLFVTSLGYAAAVVCLPRFVNLCFQIIYRDPGAEGISLEKFTTWCLIYALFLIGAGTVQQWMFVLGRTTLCHDYTRLLLYTKMTVPHSIGGSEVAEMGTGDVLALKSFWQGVHCGFRALCWAAVSAVLVLARTPELGGLMLGMGILYFLAGLLYDVFCIEKSSFSSEEYVRACVSKIEITGRKHGHAAAASKEDDSGDASVKLLDPHADVLAEMEAFNRGNLADQHVHVYSRAVQNMMVLLSPILILYLANHLVEEGRMASADIGYSLCYLALGAWSVMAFNRNCNLIVENASRAARLIAFGNRLADTALMERARKRASAAAAGSAAAAAPGKKGEPLLKGGEGLGGDGILVYMGVKKAGVVLVLGLLCSAFVAGAIYFCASMKEHVDCSESAAVCSLEGLAGAPAPQWMTLRKRFDGTRGCVFEHSNSKILYQCSNAMQKRLKGVYAFGTTATVRVSFTSWVDNRRVLERAFLLPSNGLENNPKSPGAARRRGLRMGVAGTLPVTNTYTVGLEPDAEYEPTPSDDTPPPSWSCSSFYYNAADGCDCNCGARDPDCDDASAFVYGCAADDVCPLGTCVPPSESAAAIAAAAAGGGAPAAASDASNVDAAPTFVDTGGSVEYAGGAYATTADLLAAGWDAALCSVDYYNVNDGCDCGCGAYDPDCEVPSAHFYRYGAACLDTHDACSFAGVCVSSAGATVEEVIANTAPVAATAAVITEEIIEASPVPVAGGADMAAWTCNIDFYGANDGCDCGCGLYDPDCDAYALDSLLGFYPNGPTCDDTSDACHPSTATCVPAVNAGGGPQPAPPPSPAAANATATPVATTTTTTTTTTVTATETVEATEVASSTVTTVTSTTVAQTCSVVADPAASGWTGPLSYYNAYDGCDCGYGLCDPDCNGQGGPDYAQSLYGCDQDGVPGTFANFRCISGVCTSLAALAGAANNCPCGVYGTDGACTCTPALGGHSTGTTVFGAPAPAPAGAGAAEPPNAGVPLGNGAAPSAQVIHPEPCYTTQSGWGSGESWTECVEHAKNCTAWLEAYPTVYGVRNAIVELEARTHRVMGACTQQTCHKIGDKHCDMELNTPECAYDGGDCCVTTSEAVYYNPQPGQCIDPDAQVAETWPSARTVAIGEAEYRYWDHVSKSVLGISESFKIASNGFYQNALDVLAHNDTLGMLLPWNWDAEARLGKTALYDVVQPNEFNNTPALPIVLDGVYADFPIEAEAGQYLSVYLDVTFDATLEIIAPNDDGTRADPTALNHTLPDHDGARDWQGFLDDADTDYDWMACGDWFVENCSCYACYCSCGRMNVLAPENSKLFDNHCIPESTYPKGCGGAHTVHYDVWIDPGTGMTLDIEMSRSHNGDDWPMILELHPPMLAYLDNDDHCEVRPGDGAVECCWPYTESCPPRFNEEVIGLAAGVMVTGGSKKIRKYITEAGYYRVQTKSYGYGGGGYDLQLDLSPGASVPLPAEDVVYSNGGPIAYGEVLFGNITHTGEQHAYTFEGTAGDDVWINMGPDWVPSPNDATAKCGKPYGRGMHCLDTMLALQLPSGAIDVANHVNMRDRNMVGSSIGTVRVPSDPYHYETGQSSGYASYKSVPYTLPETGTYTVYASGSTVSDRVTGANFNPAYKPVGDYYLQVERVKPGASVARECPAPPEGHDMDGCANYLWSVFSGQPRHAKRHVNCEKYYPQSSPVGGNTHHGSISIVDWQVKKTGTYTLRVRSLINNCFGWGTVYCKPYAGPFDLKARVRDGPNSGPPDYSYGGDDAGGAAAGAVRKHVIPVGVPHVIKNKCEDDAAASGIATDLCYATTTIERQCADTFRHYTNMAQAPVEMYVADLAFTAAAGDVICISAGDNLAGETGDRYSAKILLRDSASGAHLATAVGGGINAGFSISGFRVPASGEYTARFSSSYLDGVDVTVSLCPERHKDVSSAPLRDCSVYAETYDWDACFSEDPAIVVSGDEVTFTGEGEKIMLAAVGVDVDADAGSYYFEIELEGTEPEFRYDSTSNEGLDWAIGLATRHLSLSGWFGVDDQSFVWRGGKRYNDGGMSPYGAAPKPGDVVGVAYSNGKLFMSVNGYWQSPGGCNFDLATTKYNNYPEATCSRQYGWSCEEPPLTYGLAWDYNPAAGRYEYMPDNSTGVDPHGYSCCPIDKHTTVNPATGKPYPRCTYQTEMFTAVLGQRPSCCPGNPVWDGECSIDGRMHEMYLHRNDWLKFKVDEVQGGKLAFPAVSGNRDMKYTLNLGSRPFTHDMPCGYRPWADLATTLTGAAETGVDTTDCWTCQGRCTTYDVGAASCSAYEDGDRFKVYSDWGMVPGGSEQKVI